MGGGVDAGGALHEVHAAALLHAVRLDVQHLAQLLQDPQQCTGLPLPLTLNSNKFFV